MRSPLASMVAGLAAVVLLGGCGGSATTEPGDPAGEPSSDAATSPGSPASTSPGNDHETDTYADAEPATLALDADLLDGVSAVRVWAGSDVEETPGQVGGGTTTAEGETVAVVVHTMPAPVAKADARAEMRYWLEHNLMSTGHARELDPVVVDGEEVLRARGASIDDLVVDHFVRATGEVTVEIDFLTPASLGEKEREEWIGQVMATVQFE